MKSNLSYPRNFTRYFGEKFSTDAVVPMRLQKTPRTVQVIPPRKCQNSSGGSSENHRGISIIQHFRQVQLNHMICIGRQQIQTFLCEEWFCRVYFDRENLQGGFSRGAETGFTIEYQPTFKLFLAAPVLIIFLLQLNNKSNFRTIQ